MIDEKWLEILIDDVRASQEIVPDAAILRVKEFLVNEFQERKFTPAELKHISAKLLEDLSPSTVEKDRNK